MTHLGRTFALAAAVVVARSVAGQEPSRPAPEPGPPAATTPAGGDLAELLARADAAWRRRDEDGQLAAIRSALDSAQALAPDDHAVLWRMARLYTWMADDPSISDDEKSRLGKVGWDAAERAIARDPRRPEGWFYAATGMGNYALGLGVVKALRQGIDRKFRNLLSTAERLDPRFDHGGIYNAWGRFYFKLPWPKYDAVKSERALQNALRVNPANVRGRVYLAELYMREDRSKEARELLQQAVAREPGAYDAPEERRNQKRARDLLTELDR